MDVNLTYDVNLSDKVSNILDSDIWVTHGIKAGMLLGLTDPIKFSANVTIFVKEGDISAELDLQPLDIKAPCVVNIRRSQILQIRNFSSNLHCSFMVISKRFSDNIYLLLKDCRAFASASRSQVIILDRGMSDAFERFYSHVAEIFRDKNNPYGYHAIVLAVASFFLEIAHRCFEYDIPKRSTTGSRISDRFIELVQQNFKTERFLEFYAKKLEVTTKHLSRTLKKCTGFSAVEWIDRYVILEAKVLLKSTNLNIQQIADELHFPTQSSFGKYFKKHLSLTPLEFRNY